MRWLTVWTATTSIWSSWSVVYAGTATLQDEDFREDLYIRPLPDGKVLSHFDFTMIASHGRWEGIKVEDGIACILSLSLLVVSFLLVLTFCLAHSLPDKPRATLISGHRTLVRRRRGIPILDCWKMGLYQMGRDCRRWFTLRRGDIRLA